MSDGETGMRGKQVDGWAMYNQIAMTHEAPHEKAWLVEMHNALVRSALQRAESQVIKEPLCVSCGIVTGLVTFMHKAFVPINAHTPYQALLGIRPHSVQPLEGGHHGDLDIKGQIDHARVREFVAGAIIEATAKQRLARGGKRNKVASMET